MMQADDDVYNADTAFEEEKGSSRSRRRRSSIKKMKREVLSLAPKLFLFYTCFYSFLCGLYLLLLKGVTSTRVGGQETLLWAFFYLGIAFIFVVSAATYASQWEGKRTQTQASTIAASSRSARSSLSSFGESESRALMNEPPPPPAAESRMTTADDDLEDVELVSTAKSMSASLRSSNDSKHIGDVDVS